MNPDIKAKWLEDLRSGEFTQGKGYLTRVTPDGEKDCCWGLLCRLAVTAGIIGAGQYDDDAEDAISYDGGIEMPTEKVLDWAGIPPRAVAVSGKVTCLETLNDGTSSLGQYSFAQIADIIEEQM